MNTDNKISRRDALKRMGAAVISSTVASSGLLSLTSCGGKKTSALSFILPERATAGYGTAQHSADGKAGKV